MFNQLPFVNGNNGLYRFYDFAGSSARVISFSWQNTPCKWRPTSRFE